MLLRSLSFCLILSFFSVTAMAGSGHSHGGPDVNKAMAQTIASNAVASFTKRNKLDKSWASITASSVEQRMFKGNPEWVAVFVNDKITDAEKRKLYVFLTMGGDLLGANFSGK